MHPVGHSPILSSFFSFILTSNKIIFLQEPANRFSCLGPCRTAVQMIALTWIQYNFERTLWQSQTQRGKVFEVVLNFTISDFLKRVKHLYTFLKLASEMNFLWNHQCVVVWGWAKWNLFSWICLQNFTSFHFAQASVSLVFLTDQDFVPGLWCMRDCILGNPASDRTPNRVDLS